VGGVYVRGCGACGGSCCRCIAALPQGRVACRAALTVGVVCDGNHGRIDAGAHALHLAQREHAILGGLANVHACSGGRQLAHDRLPGPWHAPPAASAAGKPCPGPEPPDAISQAHISAQLQVQHGGTADGGGGGGGAVGFSTAAAAAGRALRCAESAPRWSLSAFSMCCAPCSLQGVVPQTITWYLPILDLLYMV
jgi:hypothetical protein